MCLVLAMVFLSLSYNYFINDNVFAMIASIVVALGFLYLMAKNIRHMKKEKRKNDN